MFSGHILTTCIIVNIFCGKVDIIKPMYIVEHAIPFVIEHLNISETKKQTCEHVKLKYSNADRHESEGSGS